MGDTRVPVDLNVPDQWNRHVGSIWADVLRDCGFRRKCNLVEIAPGDVNKVGYGLKELGFSGRLFVVEPDVKACVSILQQYRACLPGVEVTPVPYTIGDAAEYLPRRVNVIVANHPLDDMIIGKSFEDEAFQRFFDGVSHRAARADQLRQSWAELERRPDLLERIKADLCTEWFQLIKKAKPELVVIAQYESYFFRTNGILAPDIHARDLLDRIRDRYGGSSPSDLHCPKEGFAEDPTRWLVVRP